MKSLKAKVPAKVPVKVSLKNGAIRAASVDQKLGHLIRDYRQKNNFSQRDLSRRLGYTSAQFVSLFERAESKVPFFTLGQLIAILGLPEKKIVDLLVDNFENSLKADLRKGKEKARSVA